ncbi:hypothetical protein [Xanthomonas sacchari]|uniref:hypothetical protein n=1 Tax=Xanthomonas sacchari TaxID=56458 RepID=UPI0020C366BA|nr:hypothetical protein [Xanthomonas sacchari]
MIEFKRSGSGLLIPEQLELHKKRSSRLATLVNSVGLSMVVNLFMILIQLVTVWILWKTYQDTVVPNRQKELLSEQVAQLELEHTRRTKEVVLTRQRVQSLNNELQARHMELTKLATEHQYLLAEAATARANAEHARLSEATAKISANKAQSGLEASQWSIYYQNASVVLMLPHMIMIRKLGEIKRASIGAEDGKAAFHDYLEHVESIWPNMNSDAELIARELRKDETKFYPKWMKEEFASYFIKEAGNLSCQRPDFVAIKAEVDKKFDAAAATAMAEKKKEQAERQAVIDEAMRRRVAIPYPDSVKSYEIRVAVSDATYKMIDEIEERLRKSIEKCNGQFDPIGDKFFAGKGVSQPTMPGSVFEEFKR